MRRLGLLSLLLVTTACPRTEPPEFDQPIIYPDAGPMDATTDAGVACTVAEVTCPIGQYCGPRGECIDVPTKCATTSDCAFDDVCRTGACVAHPRACPEDGICADPIEVCIAAGFCAPARSADVPFSQTCAQPDDCGPAGICRNNLCTACTRDFECTGNWICSLGTCIEQTPCFEDEECYPGNTCLENVCRRSTDCTEDPSNDDVNMATVLTEAYLFGASICGDADFDYYKLELPELTGARIVITSTRSVATIEARAIDDVGSELPYSARLVLPGITVIDVPGDILKSTVILELFSLEASAEYAIDVQFHPIACAGDDRDLYGDGFRSNAALVSPGEIALTACADDDDWMAIDLQRGDALQVAIAWDPETGANLDLEIYDATGATPIASGTSATGAFEVATSPRTTANERFYIRVFAHDVPTFGAPYAIAIAPVLARRYGACDAARELDLSSGSNVVTSGSLRGALDLGAPFCGFNSSVDPARGDVLLRVVPPAPPSVITATIRQRAGSTSTISIALLDDCTEDLSVEGCGLSPQPYRPSTVSVLRDSADPVWLFISTDGTNDQIDFDLEVRADTPSTNDICANAIALTSSATVNAGTIGATNDVRLTAMNACGENGFATGPDRFYSMRLEGGERAGLELSGSRGGFLWVSTDCTMMTATCVASGEITSYGPARVALAPTQTTTYAIAVDGLGDGTAGPYLLRAIREPQFECIADSDCMMPERCDHFACTPIPANDVCATPEHVVFADNRARVSGSIEAASSNYQLSCSAEPNLPDVVYSVDVPAGVLALVVRVADAEFDSVVGIRRTGAACELGPDLACNDDENLPYRVFLSRATMRNPTPGTYAIIVDSYVGEGAFTLELELVR